MSITENSKCHTNFFLRKKKINTSLLKRKQKMSRKAERKLTERKENFLIFIHSCHVHDWDEKFFITIINIMMMTVELVDQNDFRNWNCARRLPVDFQYSLKCSPKCEEIWQNKAKNQRILSVENFLLKLWGVLMPSSCVLSV